MPPLQWNQKAIDWLQYETAIWTEMESVDISQGTVDEATAVFSSAMHRVNDSLCQRKGMHNTDNVWWNPVLAARRRRVRKARKKWQVAANRQLSAEVVLAIAYRHEQRLYKDELLRAKEQSWRNFVSTEGNANPWEKYIVSAVENRLTHR